MPVGKSLDRAHLGSLNAGKVVEDDARDTVCVSRHYTILPGTAREGARTLMLGTASHSKGAKLAPGKGMRVCGPRRCKLLGNDFQERIAGGLEVALKDTTAVAQEKAEGTEKPLIPLVRTFARIDEGGTHSELEENALAEGKTIQAQSCPLADGSGSGRGRGPKTTGGGRSTPFTTPHFDRAPVTDEIPSRRVDVRTPCAGAGSEDQRRP